MHTVTMVGCKNCGSHFTDREMLLRKPPAYPWPLTAVGKRIADENIALGAAPTQCPNCGCRTLRH